MIKKIIHLFYELTWWLCLPLVRHYLRKRALKAPEYLENWAERFAKPYVSAKKHVIWIHAVSVGETRAAQPIITALQNYFPNSSLLITQMTPTGRQTAINLYPNADVRYLPYDRAKYVKRFFADHQPIFGVLMETEIWPNLIYAASQANVPLFLANARLSEKSLRSYLRIGVFIRPAIAALTAIAAQSEEDAMRLTKLGASNIKICGNSKYDVTPEETQLKRAKQLHQIIGSRRVFLCASTRDGEEELILNAWHKFSASAKDILLLIVPRHPERFSIVEDLAKAKNYSVQRRSENLKINASTQVLIGDSMGEMFAYYTVANLAFIGGSLVPLGGQNLIEAAQMGVPSIFGLSMFNFQQASELALSAGAAIQVNNAEELIERVLYLFNDSTQMQQMQSAALNFSNAHSGASKRTAAFIRQFLI